MWNEIAQKLAVARHASLQRTVTVFENLDLALADATIALYDAKYHYLVWRPVTAIELGNTIGNPGITGDPRGSRSRSPRLTRPIPAPTPPSARQPRPCSLPSTASTST